MSLATATVIGNIGADAELRYLPNGNPVTSFSVCANERRRSGENIVEDQQWFKVNLFGNSAEKVAEYLTKGTLVYVAGRLKPELWTGTDGKARLTMNVNTNDVRLLGRSRASSETSPDQTAAAPDAPAGPAPDLSDEDIPF